MDRVAYRAYLLENFIKYMDVDIDVLVEGGKVFSFHLDYLDDYLLDVGEEELTEEEIEDLVVEYMDNLGEEDQNRFLTHYLQVEDCEWEDITWEIKRDEKGLYVYIDGEG